MRTEAAAPVTIRRLSEPRDWQSEIAADVLSGLRSSPKRIPSKYFYDARGSELFEQITRLPEYYLTRTERSILEASAADIVMRSQPSELVELGAGSAEKTRLLLDAMLAHTSGRRFVPIDISEAALVDAVRALCNDYPDLAIDGLVGDFDRDLRLIPRQGRRLITFLGSTIGNLVESERMDFYRSIAGALDGEDRFLLGVDLVKDPVTMVAAYDDEAGITAAFTRNILAVVNRELQADFAVRDFAHRPVWNAGESRMEAWLEAKRAMRVSIPGIGISVDLDRGERIHTEVSYKFTKATVSLELRRAGLEIEHWYTDSVGGFGLALTRPHPRSESGCPARGGSTHASDR